MKTLYLCGAGNVEAIRLAVNINRRLALWKEIVLLDDDVSKHGESILGVEIAGPFALLNDVDPGDSEVANLVGRTTPRRWRSHRKIAAYGLPFAKLVSPDVDRLEVDLAVDIIVHQAAILGPLSSVDEGSMVFMGAMVGHGARIGRFCVAAPGAVLNARVELEEGVYVGTNAAVLPDVKIGAWATVGAGSVVMRDVPSAATVMGVPAKTIIPPELKLRMRGSESLPSLVREELARRLSDVDGRRKEGPEVLSPAGSP